MPNTSQIWNDFSDALKHYINRFVKNEEVANDLLQETFIKIHLNIHKIKEVKSLKSWIYTIAHNVVMDYFKKESKIKNNVQFDLLVTEKNNEEHSHKDCLVPLIDALPEIYREAILLSEIKGLKQVEVAKILSISLSGAKSRIQRGRKLLKQGFIDCCEFKIDKSGYLFGAEKTKDECKVCNV